ncbi:MAG: RIP metalloprotease RseP [Chloroflexi bacterium]|nr:RIP metalloprotease RseP [Chloroflexota bacterium]
MLITMVAFLAVLVVLVIAHELGHFFTAKASGVRVDEFGLGFPPRLLSFKKGETRYSLNIVPLGGFVKMAGEEDPGVPGSLASKGIATRIMVLSAGSLMNFLLPFLLFSIAFMVPHNAVSGQVFIKEVAPGSPAERAGIRPGDQVLEIDGNAILNVGDLHRTVQSNLGNEITVLVRSADATEKQVRVTPRWRPPEGQGALGVVIEMQTPTLVRQSYPIWQAIPMGAQEMIETFVLFKNVIISMIAGVAPVAVAGPVGIAQITGEVAKAGLSPLLEFSAFLSINLAIINIFPLPALDGGRIAFVLLEWVRRGKRISPKTEGLVHLIGFAMLMALVAVITYRDILRIISGDGFMP